jgi:hypothetical protein
VGASTAALAAATTPRLWQGLAYRPLSDVTAARPLFEFAARPWPDASPLVFAWGAHGPGDRLVAAVVAERRGDALLLHGPVVVEAEAPLEVAAQLVAAALDHAQALAVATVFARPQSLDRIWVRFGFIPVPEGTLPDGFPRGERGLFAWRGGSALFTLREPERD